jgi:hypothetical protein
MDIELLELNESAHNSFIGVWKINPSEDFCNNIVDFFEQSKEIPKVKVNNSSKKDTEMCIYDTTNQYINFFKSQILGECYYQYCKKYEYCIAREVCSSILKIQKYEPNECYQAYHSERNNLDPMNISRHLVWMMYLNNVEDGGETEFYYQRTKIKPESGKILIWPCDWTHTHRGIVSLTQVKYIMTGWYNHRILHEQNFK